MANGVAAVTFDPLAFVKRLTKAGLSVEAAETFATEQSRLIEQVSAKVDQATAKVASKDDFKEHKSETVSIIEANIEKHESKVLQAISALDSKLEAQRKDNEILRKDIHHEISDLRKDNELLRSDITWIKWILSVSVAGIFMPLLKGMFQ